MIFRSTTRGMTLVEVMVALALLSLLATGIVTTFRFGQRAYAQVTRVESDLHDIVVTQRFLRQTLESTYPFELPIGPSQQKYGLEGQKDRMEFSAPMPLAAGSSGYFRDELALSDEPNGTKSLVVSAAVDRNGYVSSTLNENREVLIERVREMELAYFDSEDSAWHSVWSGKQRNPTLLRLRVLFDAHDARRWPELLIAPRITDDANCEFDPVARDCRRTQS